LPNAKATALIKVLKGSSKEEARKIGRLRDSEEHRRRQREIDEERKRRLQRLPTDLRLCGF
jgi:hypothetical protein